jgi:hypothetical protein
MAPRDNNPLAPALAAGGALLLLISLILSWYSVDISAQGQSVGVDVARPDTGTLLLVAAIGVAIYFAVVRFRGSAEGHGGLLVGLGAATLLYILVNLIKKPQLLDLLTSAFDEAKSQAGGALPDGTDFGVGVGPGLWVALVGSLLLLAAGLAALGVIGGSSGGSRATTGATAQPGGIGGPPSPAPGGFGGGGGGATQVQPTPGAGAGGGAPAPADSTPGWKPDPYGQAQMRYWDGNAWTEHTN